MGHERIGFLPHTKQWQGIVGQLASFGIGEISIAQIANETLKAVKKTYEAMPFDESVIKALSFLATLSYSANLDNQADFLNENGYTVDSQMSLFSLIASAQDYITTETGSLETNKLAKDAAMQAVIDYQERHKMFQREKPASENDLNDKIEAILKVQGSFTREHPTLQFWRTEYRPDHAQCDILIETKYIRDKTTPSRITEGIAADITKAPSDMGLMFVVYDPDRQISDDLQFISSFEEKRNDCFVRVYR